MILTKNLMKTHPEILFDEYRQARKVNLSLEQFKYILNLFPSLIVCMADGKLDPEEWQGIERLTQGLMIEFGEGLDDEGKASLEKSFNSEFRYLLEHLDQWQVKFLDALKDHIRDSKMDKEFVLESMYLFANSSEGISDEEQEAIDQLSDQLSLKH